MADPNTTKGVRIMKAAEQVAKLSGWVLAAVGSALLIYFGWIGQQALAHQFETVPAVAILQSEQCKDSCIRRCQNTCTANGISLAKCSCSHCNSECL